MIRLENVAFEYEKNRTILEQINLQAKAKESIGLIGENGVGKSTLLKLMVGLCQASAGEIHMAGYEMNQKNLAAIREKTGYVFQDSDSQLFMTTVYEDVAFGPRNYGLTEAEVEERVTHALEQVHLNHLREKKIYQMSGGEKKLTSVATILAMNPDIILLDEPSVALDPKNRRNLIGILNELSCLKVVASHDLDFIWDTCERTILMYQGKIVKDGATRDILRDRELLERCGMELPLRFYSE